MEIAVKYSAVLTEGGCWQQLVVYIYEFCTRLNIIMIMIMTETALHICGMLKGPCRHKDVERGCAKRLPSTHFEQGGCYGS